MNLRLDITGRVYKRLTVIEKVASRGQGTWWRCHCSCGAIVYQNTSNLQSGNTGSCGCLSATMSSERRKIKNPEQEFWKRVKIGGPHECWPWIAAEGTDCYGSFLRGGAHVFAFKTAKGRLPKGKMVCHSCDYKPCCNPAHLFSGSGSDNMLDASKKKRLFFQRHPEELRRGENHGMAKLTVRKVIEIRRLYQKGTYTQRELADRFNCSTSGMNHLVHNRIWKHVL